MIGLGFDENFNNDILRALLRRNPGLDLARIQGEWEGQVRYLPLR